MSRWLSASWEPNWRSFQYYNLYRLVVAGLMVAGMLVSPVWRAFFHVPVPDFLDWLGSLYLVFIFLGGLLSLRWRHFFNYQLTAQVLIDSIAISLFMYTAGGVSSGLGILLIVSLTAASLVGRGRLVLFYAAIASLCVLAMQFYRALDASFENISFAQAGLLSAGFFTTAALARLLGQRLMANEDLARRRGIALENQRLISRRVIERMQGGVLVVGGAGQILRRNPVAIDMLGGSESGGLLDDTPELGRCFRAWRMGVGPETTVVMGLVGTPLWARFASTESSDGESLIFLEDLGRAQEEAQQLKLAALGRLTASIAHEIRNPLASISHAGDLLREERRGETQERLLKILHDNVGRLNRIVTDILELGRRDRGQPENLPLAGFLEGFANEFVHTEEIDAALLAVSFEAGLSLYFDRSHLQQVLWNLLGNALRHASRRPGCIRLRALGANDAKRVELHVQDDGPGVPEADRSKVFEPFFTTHTQGTGLGLFIARELCEANGATLELAPEDSGGHFIITGKNDTCQ